MNKLTIGIPTLGKRPERTIDSIESVLVQTVPVSLVVACQGEESGISELKEKYKHNSNINFVTSDATCLWENWRFAANCCETEYFSWLQDDDVLHRDFARRVIAGFASQDDASCYLSRIAVTYVNSGVGCWWQGAGPWIPMDLLRGGYTGMRSELLAAGAYVASHALSPAVAFRATPEILSSLENVPKDADLFAERSVLAEFSRFGSAVCDPAIVGYWIHHGGNESFRLNPIPGEGEREYRVMCKHIDSVLEGNSEWPNIIKQWTHIVGINIVKNWYDNTIKFRSASKNLDIIISMLEIEYPSILQPKKGKSRGKRILSAR